MKNLVICSDGTNNKLVGDLTNVARISQVAIQNDQQGVFYDPGVGTMAAPDQKTWFGKRWSLVKGLAFGDGLDVNVFDAYGYLVRNYQDGDRVFLFGFSRGAFTVRVLAGMLHGVGLLHPGTENILPDLWKHYRGIRILPEDASPEEKADARKYHEKTEELRRKFTRPCPVAFLGPWDTVGSVGMYNMNQAFPFTFNNPSVAVVRHAVSLDEQRAAFRSNVFKADETPVGAKGRRRVMNVWFPGVHSDVGGGYPWPESGLAMQAFQWIVREAQDFGLLVDQAKYQDLLQGCAPSATAQMHESLHGAWKGIEYLPARRFDWKVMKTIWRYQPNKARTMIESPILHRSVQMRYDSMQDYRPPSLPANWRTMPFED